MGWLGLGRALADRRVHPGVPWYRWKAGWDFCFRFWLLNFIAPALMIQKALPAQLVDMLTLPASVMVRIIHHYFPCFVYRDGQLTAM